MKKGGFLPVGKMKLLEIAKACRLLRGFHYWAAHRPLTSDRASGLVSSSEDWRNQIFPPFFTGDVMRAIAALAQKIFVPISRRKSATGTSIGNNDEKRKVIGHVFWQEDAK
ncbi:MAG: hypothetical protein QXD09_07825 [Candidatus Caldarchaeum sp.]